MPGLAWGVISSDLRLIILSARLIDPTKGLKHASCQALLHDLAACYRFDTIFSVSIPLTEVW